MKVEYIKGLGCPVNINWGKEVKAITIEDAKQLQEKLAEVIEQAEKEPELSEFEQAVKDLCWKVGMGEVVYKDDITKKTATRLLNLARKEIEEELQEKVIRDYWKQAADQCVQAKEEGKAEALKEIEQDPESSYAFKRGVEYGKEEALKDLPRWKKKEEEKFGYYCSCGFLVSDGYEISIAELKRKLPGFKED